MTPARCRSRSRSPRGRCIRWHIRYGTGCTGARRQKSRRGSTASIVPGGQRPRSSGSWCRPGLNAWIDDIIGLRSASDKHGHCVEHVTRHVQDGIALRNGPKTMSKLPYRSSCPRTVRGTTRTPDARPVRRCCSGRCGRRSSGWGILLRSGRRRGTAGTRCSPTGQDRHTRGTEGRRVRSSGSCDPRTARTGRPTRTARRGGTCRRGTGCSHPAVGPNNRPRGRRRRCTEGRTCRRTARA